MNSLAKRFLEEAPRQWSNYNSHVFSLRGHIKVVVTKEEKETFKGHYEIKEKNDCRLSQKEAEDFEDHSKEQTVYALNPNYIFSLNRKAAGLPWRITDVRKRRSEIGSSMPDEYKDEIGSGIQSALTRVGGWQLPDLLVQPNFRVRHAALVNRGGLELIQIDFESPHPVTYEPFSPIQSGTIFFDPQRSWCVREYEIQTQYSNSAGVTRSETIEIRDSSTPRFPLPVRIAYSKTSRATEPKFADQTVVSSSVIDYDLDESHPPGDEEFLLSAFGLHEPFGFGKKPTRRYLWVALGGLICLVLAALFRWLARRAKTKAAS